MHCAAPADLGVRGASRPGERGPRARQRACGGQPASTRQGTPLLRLAGSPGASYRSKARSLCLSQLQTLGVRSLATCWPLVPAGLTLRLQDGEGALGWEPWRGAGGPGALTEPRPTHCPDCSASGPWCRKEPRSLGSGLWFCPVLPAAARWGGRTGRPVLCEATAQAHAPWGRRALTAEPRDVHTDQCASPGLKGDLKETRDGECGTSGHVSAGVAAARLSGLRGRGDGRARHTEPLRPAGRRARR